MSVSLAVALLALLVALFCLVALVAVYARLRTLEATRAASLSGYATIVGRPGPLAVRPRPGERGAVVAVLDASCALCHGVRAALDEAAAATGVGTRFVALTDRADDVAAGPSELVVDAAARADLYEGYAPTLLALDAAGAVTHRSFVYPDTDLRVLLRELTGGREVSRT